MRTKHFIVLLFCVIFTTIFFIVLGPAGEPNDSLKSIVTHTHQQLNKLQENLRATEKKKLQIDLKYLALLGFSDLNYPKNSKDSNNHKDKYVTGDDVKTNYDEVVEISKLPLQQALSHSRNKDKSFSQSGTISRLVTTPYNGTKANFSIVTYVQDDQAPSAILFAQNVAAKFPDEHLLIYDLGLSDDDSRALTAYCNISKCSVINYDLSLFPSHVSDQRLRAYRPIVIKDALTRSKCVLFAENYIRFRGGSNDLQKLRERVSAAGVLGWNIPTAVSTRTHPKMFDYFETEADSFIFLHMIDLDVAVFSDSVFVEKNIMLPWLKCALSLECIDPIGAQANGCKYNKKPQYRYSGCHDYDVSAFNIVLGITWHLDGSKYSIPSGENKLFYRETMEKATRTLANRQINNSETLDLTLPNED